MRHMTARTSVYLIVGLLALAVCASRAGAAQTATQPAEKDTAAMDKKDAAVSKPAAASQPADKPQAEAKAPRVVMETSMGKLVIELYPDKAPVSVENFLKYVDSGFYNDTIFHRIVPGFVIQGGGFGSDHKQKETNKPIINEGKNGLKNLRGTLSMARQNDLNSATSQFFINLKDNVALDYPNNGGYAVFGKVIEGMDVVDKVAKTPTGSKQVTVTTPMGPRETVFQEVPQTPVVVQSAKRQ